METDTERQRWRERERDIDAETEMKRNRDEEIKMRRQMRGERHTQLNTVTSHNLTLSKLILQLHYITRRFESELCYYFVREGTRTGSDRRLCHVSDVELFDLVDTHNNCTEHVCLDWVFVGCTTYGRQELHEACPLEIC